MCLVFPILGNTCSKNIKCPLEKHLGLSTKGKKAWNSLDLYKFSCISATYILFFLCARRLKPLVEYFQKGSWGSLLSEEGRRVTVAFLCLNIHSQAVVTSLKPLLMFDNVLGKQEFLEQGPVVAWKETLPLQLFLLFQIKAPQKTPRNCFNSSEFPCHSSREPRVNITPYIPKCIRFHLPSLTVWRLKQRYLFTERAQKCACLHMWHQVLWMHIGVPNKLSTALESIPSGLFNRCE